jgi:3-isopropylmalate/(R)-2-methylmalate dehydratase small subunit
MEQFTTHTGTAVPLRRSNVDTDQIIPAVYLKRVTKTGFEDGLFAAWRNDPDFVLNRPMYSGATIGSRFGDIFRSNAGKAGLLVALVDQKIVEELWEYIESNPTSPLTVDLGEQRITAASFEATFEIDPYTRWRLMEGLDDIGLTLRHAELVEEFELRRAPFKPATLPAKVETTAGQAI